MTSLHWSVVATAICLSLVAVPAAGCPLAGHHLWAWSGQAPAFPSGLNGTFELAIDLPTSADADSMFARVRPVYAPRDEPWGMHSSMVADPDGNLIEIGSWNRGAGSGD